MSSSKKKADESESSPVDHLCEAWKKHGKVLFKCAFVTIPDTYRDFLTRQVDSWKSENLTKCGKGGSIRAMNHSMYSIKDIEPTDNARYLFLKSGHNDLADAIVAHLSYEYNAMLMKGSNHFYKIGYLSSILQSLDNVTDSYLKRDFKWSLILHLVNNHVYLTKKLKNLLVLTKKMY